MVLFPQTFDFDCGRAVEREAVEAGPEPRVIGMLDARRLEDHAGSVLRVSRGLAFLRSAPTRGVARLRPPRASGLLLPVLFGRQVRADAEEGWAVRRAQALGAPPVQLRRVLA